MNPEKLLPLPWARHESERVSSIHLQHFLLSSFTIHVRYIKHESERVSFDWGLGSSYDWLYLDLGGRMDFR